MPDMVYLTEDGFDYRMPAPLGVNQMEIWNGDAWVPVTDAEDRADVLMFGLVRPTNPHPDGTRALSSQEPMLMPTIQEVTFPSIMKGISVQYQPVKKRKKLARKPKRFEASLMSLSTTGPRLDAMLEDLKGGLVTVLGNPEAIHTVMMDALSRAAHFGADEVRKEFLRQGLAIGAPRTELIELDSWTDRLFDAFSEELHQAFADVQARLARKRLSGDRRRAWAADLMERRVAPIVTRFANRTINDGHSKGRSLELRTILGRIDLKKDEYPIDLSSITVVQTAIQDSSLCDECAAVDGETYDYGSDRMYELEPPYAKCLGGDSCRCSQLALIGKDSYDVAEVSDQELEDILQEDQ